MKKITDILTPHILKRDEGHITFVLLYGDTEVGVLYFERPKSTWTNKPIMPTKWVCVDAKIDQHMNQVMGGLLFDEFNPKDIVEWCQDLLISSGNTNN